jgi:diguanylate cyclase (GGDEF)-like protein
MHFPQGAPLTAFAPDEVDALVSAATRLTFAANDVIVEEGQPGDSMYLLLEGTAEARLHGGRTVRAYGSGHYFGEFSFVRPGHARSATVVATAPAVVGRLDQTSVETLTARHPRAIITLLRRACLFLVETERHLVVDLKQQNEALTQTIARLELTRQRLTEEERTARTDALTGLHNRRTFDAELPLLLERASAIDGSLALLALDLDHFKPVNDTLGHPAGDFVLREVGRIIRTQTRKTDLPCRVGGDEFLVVLCDLTEEAAQRRAESLRTAIATFPHPGNDQDIRITTTMGGTMYRRSEEAAALTARADEALYEAKRAGRNRVGWR